MYSLVILNMLIQKESQSSSRVIKSILNSNMASFIASIDTLIFSCSTQPKELNSSQNHPQMIQKVKKQQNN